MPAAPPRTERTPSAFWLNPPECGIEVAKIGVAPFARTSATNPFISSL